MNNNRDRILHPQPPQEKWDRDDWWFFATLVAAWLVIGLLASLTGCATQPQYSPVPPASTWTNGAPTGAVGTPRPTFMVELPPEPLVAARGDARPTAVQPAGSYLIAWDYGDTNYRAFNVWRGSTPAGPFTPWRDVATTSTPLPIDADAAFFIVRASNTVTHLVSDWAR